jgi:hypothetical protein
MTTPEKLLIVVAALLAIKLIIDVLVAFYGRDRGHPFWPLLISCVFLGFPVVLFVVAMVPERPIRQRMVAAERPLPSASGPVL